MLRRALLRLGERVNLPSVPLDSRVPFLFLTASKFHAKNSKIVGISFRRSLSRYAWISCLPAVAGLQFFLKKPNDGLAWEESADVTRVASSSPSIEHHNSYEEYLYTNHDGLAKQLPLCSPLYVIVHQPSGLVRPSSLQRFYLILSGCFLREDLLRLTYGARQAEASRRLFAPDYVSHP